MNAISVLRRLDLNSVATTNRLLLEVVERIDNFYNFWLQSEFNLARTTHIEVGSTKTIVYQNGGDHDRLLEIFNTDPAQTVIVGLGSARWAQSLPIFPYKSEKLSVPAGQTLYAYVEDGTVDIRFGEFSSLRLE